MSPGSVTRWIADLKNGDCSAAQPLWERYHSRLIGLARQRLIRSAHLPGDEEDVVQIAFHRFFRGIVSGRFPRLDDRNDLWRLLVLITSRSAIDKARRNRLPVASAPTLPPDSRSIILAENETLIEEIACIEPTPDLAAEMIEQYERLLHRLDEPTLRRIAVWKLEGFTNGEIAKKLSCSRRTVIRKLEIVRLIWSNESET